MRLEAVSSRCTAARLLLVRSTWETHKAAKFPPRPMEALRSSSMVQRQASRRRGHRLWDLGLEPRRLGIGAHHYLKFGKALPSWEAGGVASTLKRPTFLRPPST